MKTTKNIPPAPSRRTHPARPTRRPTPQAPAFKPQPAARPHDFLALCLYPGMASHSTAA